MSKSSSMSIRVDGSLKEESEKVMAEYGLNMTTTVNMLLKQIVREQAIPLSLNANTENKLRNDLVFAHLVRMAGNKGTPAGEVADELDAIIMDIENGK